MGQDFWLSLWACCRHDAAGANRLGVSSMMAATIVHPDNVAVVTGAALGIGRAMCRRFAEAAMSVVVADLPGEELDRTVDALKAISPRGPDRIVKVPTNVADPEQVQRLRDTVMTKFGKVNLLANNAATRIGRGHEAPLADWRKAMDVNLWGQFSACAPFYPPCWRPRRPA
jgi:NAD(P)-dependent dehydrogenase (short-subunit alcohol dehydrogenase family)